MLGTQPTGAIEGVVLSIDGNELMSVTVNGRPAQIAIVDEHGRVVAAGDEVAREVEAVAVNCYVNFLQGVGWMKVSTRLPDELDRIKAEAKARRSTRTKAGA